MILIRQLAFNLVFYIYTAFMCIALVPFALLPRSIYVNFLRAYFWGVYWIEKHVLGLDFEVRGAEHLPAKGPYLVAAKHYSFYETMKLYPLFHDPAIILKKELTYIPLWGWLLMKGDMIAIDRKSGVESMKSLANEATRIKAQGRPITIFPQGTRVSIHETVKEKPYKRGIIRMYEASGLPIIPVATNSGVFWPKRAFFIKPGKVVFEILPPIPPGLPSAEVMQRIETPLEETSARLVKEALEQVR